MMNTDAPDLSDGYSGGDRGISTTLDATLDLLSNQRRRYVLYYLREQGGSVSLDELATQVTRWERDDGESADEHRVRADLYHCQLPRLDEAGAVTFDSEAEYVSLEDSNDAPLAEYLELAAREENVV